MNGVILALRYLTIVPLPRRLAGRPVTDLRTLGGAARWFPAVGAAIGVALVAVERLAGHLFTPLLAALLTVTAWKLVTGGIHLDGLADCLDGLVGRDPDHRLAIMRDSRIGAFGAMGLVLFLLLEIAAVAELGAPHRWRALLVAPTVARAMPALLARLFPPARREGQGAAFHAGVRPAAVPVALGVALAVALATLGALGIVVLAVATVAVVLLARFQARRLGGLTGDVHGAAVEVAELAVLLTVSAWSHAPR